MPEDIRGGDLSHREEPLEGSSMFEILNCNLPSASAKLVPSRNFMSCSKCRQRKSKCDRIKPACSTCLRLNQDCEYPKRKREGGLRRRSGKELEARLVEVESKLGSQPNQSYEPDSAFKPRSEDIWTSLYTSEYTANINIVDEGRFLNRPGQSQYYFCISDMADVTSQNLVRLGVQQPLPNEEIQQELFHLYFDKIHHQIPIIHKHKFLASLKSGPSRKAPMFFQYAMWAIAASISSKYEHLADIFYERARRYADAAEMMGHVESFITIYIARCWNLIAMFETKKTYFTRAWLSTGRCIRLVQLMGLSSLDREASRAPYALSPTEDAIEQEERRRTFWAAFCYDRWASAGTGWPMTIHESEIFTNLPSSEEAFEQGKLDANLTLVEVLESDAVARLPCPFAGVILASALLGRIHSHTHLEDSGNHPEDFTNGEFWQRHREIDNTLLAVFLGLPESLRLSQSLDDLEVVLLHMTFHASSICLHQASILACIKYKLNPNIQSQSIGRCLVAADEIIAIMHLISHDEAASMNPLTSFCLYVAGSVYIYDLKLGHPPSPRSSINLEFLLSAMAFISNRHPIMSHFTAQIEFDIEAADFSKETDRMKVNTSSSSLRYRTIAITPATSDDKGNVNFNGSAYISPLNSAEIRSGRLKLLPPVSGIVSREWTECTLRPNVQPGLLNLTGYSMDNYSSSIFPSTSGNLMSQTYETEVVAPCYIEPTYNKSTIDAALLGGVCDDRFFEVLDQSQAPMQISGVMYNLMNSEHGEEQTPLEIFSASGVTPATWGNV